MSYQITAKIWISANSKEEAEKVYDAIDGLPGVVEMDWLDGGEV